MSTDNPDPPARGRCRGQLETAHAICPNCGARADNAPVAAEPVPETPRPTPMTAIAASRWKVLALLFVVLGPLALPVLWKSPRFSRAGKLVLTILVAIQTVAVIWILWYFVSWFLDEFRQVIELITDSVSNIR